MRNQKDIGSYFEDKLRDKKKSPNNNLWEKIKTSLDEKERRKRNSLPYLLTGLAVFIFVGLFLIINKSEADRYPSENSNDTQISEIPLSTSEKNNKKYEVESNIPGFTETTSKSKKESFEISTKSGYGTGSTTSNPPEKTTEKQNTRSAQKTDSWDDSFTITKKYYYYNSVDKEQWNTTDEFKIDSLLSERKKIADSIKIFEKGTIEN